MPRDRLLKQSLGSLHTRIKESRVLMVGAGGIGCELLKNLLLTGFGEVHIIDLDTIDLSNLNRQFLFRHEHIKKSKALVAKETAGKFNLNVKIEAHHANIKDPQFNVEWFKSFTIVFNALDNLEARRHVNKMCLAANVPLVESGTTGFNGQVQVIQKGQTECYDCNPKETPKTFPVCTIRSTPSQPIHCIVWAKSYLFTEMFGTSEDDAPELDTTQDSNNAKEIENLRHEAQALKRIRELMGSKEFPQKVFDKVFKYDVERLRTMEDMWRTRRKPDPLDFETLEKEIPSVGATISDEDQIKWSTAENFAVFCSSLRRLSDRLVELRANTTVGNGAPILSFDKDDKDTLDFVASSANLRSIIFGIDTKSEFEIKQMAGNIIPAIATTNAMAAALCVLQAFKVLRGELDKARMVFLVRSTDRVISSEPLRPPNPDCAICGVAQAHLEVDLQRATLEDLVQGLLRVQLGYGAELSVTSDIGILYDLDLDENLNKKLSDLDIVAGSFITIMDEEDDDPRVNLLMSIADKRLPADSLPIKLAETFEIARKAKTLQTATESDKPAAIASANGSATEANGKRKRNVEEADLEADITNKRGKVMEDGAKPEKNDGPVVVDGSDNGAIIIDDD